MWRKSVLLGLVLFCVVGVQAQSSYTVSGRVQDAESRAAVPGATVVLKNIKDTTLSFTSYSDTAGFFQFDQILPDSFRLTISSVGFETLSRSVKVDSADVYVGVISVPRTSRELTGVTVTTRIPPAVQKGDTVQFNASQFKVNPDASAEDLARKIPGITIEQGQVKAQGENVRRVTVDGRELFGEDATAALRNLPAEVIDKIQVFDRLSDQAQFSGFDDGNTSKEINIITKANMRNGQFGRVYGGYGTDQHYQAGGNATFFKNSRRISLVGNFNNINQQNFSQQDLLGVTSNARRGGGGGGTRGGGSGPRGGSGNRQYGSGNQGGGNYGGFGSSSNFLVGQQNGINRTNAAGINYADQWGKKVTLSGSYFFNNSNNTTNELSNRQYYLKDVSNLREQNNTNSNNYNHRFNLRMEYTIDSSNQLIITPSLSFQNNRSDQLRTTARISADGSGAIESRIANDRTSSRNGNNLNNTILYRHAFAKRGRTFSVNLNTSYNKRAGETYLSSQTSRFTTPLPSDTAERQFTDQFNDGTQLSANLVYTEPLSKQSQLQFNYNPSYSKSTSDQQAFRYDDGAEKYSLFDTSLSNQFENITKAQNAGLAFRTGTRDNSFSAGVNYQHTNLNSDQVFPEPLTVDKTFNNLLPNAMLRYKLSPRSNIRLFYRANVNTPSVTQLAGVIDPTDRPYLSMGNPNLEQQYTHVLSTRYTFTNTAKGILVMGNVFLQKANNYITNATYVAMRDSAIGYKDTLFRGEELTVPVNLDGYASMRSFATLALPLRFIKSNLNLNGGVSYNRYPGILNNVLNETRNMVYTLGTVVSSNISEQVDFTVSYSANFNDVTNKVDPDRNTNYFQHVAGLQLNLLSKNGWFVQNDLNNQFYSGLSEGYNQSYWLWNAGVGKKFLKDRKGELRLNVFDLLGQNQSITRTVGENYFEDTQNEVLRRYFMLTFTYNLRNFGKAAPQRSSGRSSSWRDGGGRRPDF